jgi:hypothetical protein
MNGKAPIRVEQQRSSRLRAGSCARIAPAGDQARDMLYYGFI